MIRRLRNNRKGEDMLVDFWAILIFALILVIFLVLFLVDKRDNAPSVAEFENKDVAFMLDSFIRAPYSRDDTKTVGEIIGEDAIAHNTNYGRTVDAFLNFFPGVGTYKNMDIYEFQLDIETEGAAPFSKTVRESELRGTNFKGWDREYSSTTMIPRPDGKDVKIILTVRYQYDKSKAFLK